MERALEALEGRAGAFNTAADRLQLIPATAKRAEGVAFELYVQRGGAAAGELIATDLKGTIKPALTRLREAYRTRTADLGRDMLSLQDKHASGRELIQERLDENGAVEAQARAAVSWWEKGSGGGGALLRPARARLLARFIFACPPPSAPFSHPRSPLPHPPHCHTIHTAQPKSYGQVRKLDEKYRGAKDALEAEVRAAAAKAEKIASDVAAMRSVVNNCLAESDERVRAVQAEHEALGRSCDAEVARLQKDLNAALEMMLNHKLHVRKALDALTAQMRQARGRGRGAGGRVPHRPPRARIRGPARIALSQPRFRQPQPPLQPPVAGFIGCLAAAAPPPLAPPPPPAAD